MSVVLKDMDMNFPEEITDENLEPVSDEELEEIIQELGDAFEKAIEEEPEPELSPEQEEILATEDPAEKARLYEKYYDKIFPAK